MRVSFDFGLVKQHETNNNKLPILHSLQYLQSMQI